MWYVRRSTKADHRWQLDSKWTKQQLNNINLAATSTHSKNKEALIVGDATRNGCGYIRLMFCDFEQTIVTPGFWMAVQMTFVGGKFLAVSSRLYKSDFQASTLPPAWNLPGTRRTCDVQLRPFAGKPSNLPRRDRRDGLHPRPLGSTDLVSVSLLALRRNSRSSLALQRSLNQAFVVNESLVHSSRRGDWGRSSGPLPSLLQAEIAR